MKPALLLALSLLCSGATAASEPCRLRVGWEEWYPLIHQQDGRLTGSEYQRARQLADGAGCRLEFVEVPWARALQLLRNGQLDMLYGASRSAERETYARFSQAYRQERMVLVVSAQSSATTDLEEVSLAAWLAEPRNDGRPRRLGLIRGFHYGEALKPVLDSNKGTRLEVRWDEQLQQMLALGRIDGYLVELSVARAQQAAADAAPMRLFTVGEHPREPMHLMFSLGVPVQVVERFDAAIRLQRTRP